MPKNKTTYKPSKEEISDAKHYLQSRMEAEFAMRHDVQALVTDAAEEIVQLAYSYNIPVENFKFSRSKSLNDKVDAIVEDLVEGLEYDMELLATANAEDDKDTDILAWIYRENHGKTLDERAKEYAVKFKRELEIGIVAAMFLKVKEDECKAAILENLKHPFASDHIREATKKGALLDIPNYGRGHTNSMLTALTNLFVFAVAEGWMYLAMLRAEEEGMIGFVTFRNSTVPCDICDDYAEVFHPMDDPFPPLHLNCVCGMVFVPKI